jgi:hypothetical protein
MSEEEARDAFRLIRWSATDGAPVCPRCECAAVYGFKTRINYPEAYSDGEACTNQAESFFSRLRRAEIGTHHRIAGPYLSAYASEMACRENYRRVRNGEQYLMAANALRSPVSIQWKGYWQRSGLRAPFAA